MQCDFRGQAAFNTYQKTPGKKQREINKRSNITEMHPGCIAVGTTHLHTPIAFDPALVSDFTLAKDAAHPGSASSNWPNLMGPRHRRCKELERWMGKSFCSHTVVTRWQETWAEKPSLTAIWQPESGELGLEVKEKIALLFTHL